MEIRGIIALDLDGTLLTPKGEVTPLAIQTLRALQEKGYLILLSTGRPPRAAESIYRQIGLRGPIVAYNGIWIYDPSEAAPWFSLSFPKELIQTLYECTASTRSCFMMESDSTIYVDHIDPFLGKFFPFDGMAMKAVSRKEELLEDAESLILGIEDDALMDQVNEVLQSYPPITLRHWRSAPYGVLYYPYATKGKALAYLMERFAVSKENVYAFGDSDNDVGFLQTAGHPFAMANAKNELLRLNFPLTKKGNAEDGVALTLIDIFGL